MGTGFHIVQGLAKAEVGYVLQELVAAWVHLILPLLVGLFLLAISARLHIVQLLLVLLRQHRIKLSLALYLIIKKLIPLLDFFQLLNPFLLLNNQAMNLIQLFDFIAHLVLQNTDFILLCGRLLLQVLELVFELLLPLVQLRNLLLPFFHFLLLSYLLPICYICRVSHKRVRDPMRFLRH